MDIVVDTRERRPFVFKGHRVIQKALITGDYSFATDVGSYEDYFCIERKGLLDLESCIYEERFDKQVHRLAELPYGFLVIEGYPSLIKKRARFLHRNPKAIMHKLYSIQAFSKVPVIFCENREEAQEYALQLIKQFVKKSQKGELEKLPQSVIMEIKDYYTLMGDYRVKKTGKKSVDAKGIKGAGLTGNGSNKQTQSTLTPKKAAKKPASKTIK